MDAHAAAITLPRDLGGGRLIIPVRGQARWTGKLGRAELLYDAVRRRWSLHVSVEVAAPEHLPRQEKWAAIDPGARMTIAVAVDGELAASLYRSRDLWKDFRYWSRRIAALQAELAPRARLCATRGRGRRPMT